MSSKNSAWKIIVALAIGALCLSMAIMMSVTAKVKYKPVITVTPGQLENPIAIIGKTDDGKYPIYDLVLNDDGSSYTTSNKKVAFQRSDLAARMIFLDFGDADYNGRTYICSFVCKDLQNHIVGLNPTFARMYSKKPTHYDLPPSQISAVKDDHTDY